MKEYRVTVRFYEELNDFIKKHPRKEDIPFSFRGRRSVKDLIESFGVPHVEVDLILINGKSVPFSQIVEEGDRISVYPRFERLDIGEAIRLREKPLRRSRFVLDVHLGKLARDMRMLGFDCDYAADRDDRTLAEISSSEERILLTRDRGLLKRKIVTRGLAVRSDDPELQLTEVLEKLDLLSQIQPFTRCLACNGRIGSLDRESRQFGRLKFCIPPRVLDRQKDFSYCPSCGKVYWKGSHYETMMTRISALLSS